MKKISIILLVFLLSASLWADPIKLTLKDTIQISETANLKLQAAKESLASSKAKVKQAEGISYGNLFVMGAFTHLDNDVTTPVKLAGDNQVIGQIESYITSILGPLPNIYLGPQNQVHLIASYAVPLYTGGKLQNSIKAAKEGCKAQENKLLADTDNTAFSAADYYLLSLLTKELVEVNKEALETVRMHKKQAEISFETGVAAKYDVIRAESAEKDHERLLSEAETNYNSSLLALKTVLDIDKEQEIELTDNLSFDYSPADTEQLIILAKNTNPGLLALKEKENAASYLFKAEKGSRAPQFSAIAAGQLLTGNINEAEPKWFAGINMMFSIFDGGITQAKISEAESVMKAAGLELKDAESYLELGIRTACLQLDTAHKSLEAAKESAALSREALRLAERRFETGNGTSIEVIDAQTALSAALTAEKAAMYQGEKCRLSIDRYCGNIRK